jgi:beta-N-acetylhexosaminidase
VASGATELRGRAVERADAALARRAATIEPLDVGEARERFEALVAGAVAR